MHFSVNRLIHGKSLNFALILKAKFPIRSIKSDFKMLIFVDKGKLNGLKYVVKSYNPPFTLITGLHLDWETHHFDKNWSKLFEADFIKGFWPDWWNKVINQKL